MTTLTNSFEGGTSGTTITAGNSGGASGSAFNTVTGPPASGTLAYDNTRAAHGTISCKIATAASSGTCITRWDVSMGTQTQIWFRQYLYVTANPAGSVRIVQTATPDGANICARFQILSTGKIQALNTSGTGVFTTTNSIPLNAWFRVEGFAIGDAAVGQVELKLFNTPDSVSPTETETSAANVNTFGAMGVYQFGLTSALTNTGPFWQDDVGISSTGYIGPVPAPAGGRRHVPAPVPALYTATVL